MPRSTLAVFRREFAGYFATPVAMVFIVVFVALASALTLYLGNFFGRGQADLQPFFMFHPWLYLFFVPAVAMRLWAEERRQGTLELLLTLPVSLTAAVIAKFLAAWAFIGVALLLTFPLWLTVAYLGDPDHGVILASYFGSFIMAGAFLAIGSCLSAATRNQVIAFVATVAVSFLFVVTGSSVLSGLLGFLPESLIEAIGRFSFLTHFQAIARGVIDLRDAVFFVSVIAVFLFATAVVIDVNKAR